MRNKIQILMEDKKKIEEGGGSDRIEEQHKAGKLTARERIGLLVDEGSFIETDQFVSHRSKDFGLEDELVRGDGIVTGYGTIDGRLVYVYASDYTALKGSMGEMNSSKIVKLQKMALKMGAPIIGLHDTAGIRLEEGLDGLAGYGRILYNSSISSGVIPQISAIYGQAGGMAASVPALSDFTFMVENMSSMFSVGPEIIKTVTGEDISKEDLSGANVHSEKTGLCDIKDINEKESIENIRELVGFLPSNNLEASPGYGCEDDLNRVEEALNDLIPENSSSPYDMKDIISLIADDKYFYELKKSYAKNLITGFIRLNGKTIGVLANQPKELAGCLDIKASKKGARFIRTCDSFNIPILNLIDVPGFLPGLEEEYGGLASESSKMIFAYSEATVPKVSLIVGKAFGGAYLSMCSKELGADQVFAWPNAEVAVMDPMGAANIIFKTNIEEADDPVSMREEMIEYYRENIASPYVGAERGYIDDIIVPSITRPKLISAFDMLETKRESNPSKKHGNIPL